ncbi:hypothetical protein GXB84_09565 [Stenotrophomonas acidaminiphila]|uniref:hypothetical protein n=1 Tax=Stenotrophomonas TaxID=40323 RepID=UPI00135288ED|nr:MULTISPECIES: hypothetical protein [Stenotrophomonas]MTI72809.1 hypothetical protein [Stenotrophomonas sp.]NCT87577.1 hypothetical protein [Stenotrophomonas acidaminiphila]
MGHVDRNANPAQRRAQWVGTGAGDSGRERLRRHAPPLALQRIPQPARAGLPCPPGDGDGDGVPLRGQRALRPAALTNFVSVYARRHCGGTDSGILGAGTGGPKDAPSAAATAPVADGRRRQAGAGFRRGGEEA